MPGKPNAAEFAAALLDPSLFPQAFVPPGTQLSTQANSVWHGTDAALGKLGLRQGTAVRMRDLTAVVSGRHVRTGARVLPDGEGFDLVFRAPNSVSFVWSQLAPGRRAQIEGALLGSAAVMLDSVAEGRPTVASLVLHAVGTVSGSVGVIPPALHVHCCLFAWLADNGTLIRPDEATLYDERNQQRSDLAAETDLADAMVRLGYPVTHLDAAGGPSFEIAGVPQQLLDDTDFWQNIGCAVAGQSGTGRW